MTTPERIVEGVYDHLCRINGEWQPIGPNDIKEILTAALPFLPVQKAQLSPKDRNTAEVGGLVDTLRSMSHDDNTRACVSVNITDSNDLAKKLFDVLHAAQKAATALEAQEAELAAVHHRYVDADESRIDAEAALAEARKALEQAEQQLDYGQVDAAHRILIRALSSPDHADAGKVEGDGWPTGEYEVDYEVICNGEWVAGSTDLNDAKHYAAVYSQDGKIEIVEARTYRRPLPSAPSEGAE